MVDCGSSNIADTWYASTRLTLYRGILPEMVRKIELFLKKYLCRRQRVLRERREGNVWSWNRWLTVNYIICMLQWTSWSTFRTAFRSRFCDDNFDRRVRDQIRARTQGAKEKIEDYLTCLLGLYDKLDGPYSVEEQLDNEWGQVWQLWTRISRRKIFPAKKRIHPLGQRDATQCHIAHLGKINPKPGKKIRDNYAQRLLSANKPKQNAAKINVDAITQAPSTSTTIISRTCLSYGIPAPHDHRIGSIT